MLPHQSANDGPQGSIGKTTQYRHKRK